mmetsp:Transcript_20481/g.54895  ORF Transcript_20481/g.54895 Transcript_20481/m.54895 type:complete len:264 (+) Transcript_20481:956-1747(+)
MFRAALVYHLEAREEMRRRRLRHLKVKFVQHASFHLEHLLPRVRLVRDVHELVDVRRVGFLVLRCDKKGGDADKLQVSLLGDLTFQVPVNGCHREKQRFRFELVLLVHINQPIHQDAAHLCVNVHLQFHISWLSSLRLLLVQVPVDIWHVLADAMRVVSQDSLLRVFGRRALQTRRGRCLDFWQENFPRHRRNLRRHHQGTSLPKLWLRGGPIALLFLVVRLECTGVRDVTENTRGLDRERSGCRRLRVNAHVLGVLMRRLHV